MEGTDLYKAIIENNNNNKPNILETSNILKQDLKKLTMEDELLDDKLKEITINFIKSYNKDIKEYIYKIKNKLKLEYESKIFIKELYYVNKIKEIYKQLLPKSNKDLKNIDDYITNIKLEIDNLKKDKIHIIEKISYFKDNLKVSFNINTIDDIISFKWQMFEELKKYYKDNIIYPKSNSNNNNTIMSLYQILYYFNNNFEDFNNLAVNYCDKYDIKIFTSKLQNNNKDIGLFNIFKNSATNILSNINDLVELKVNNDNYKFKNIIASFKDDNKEISLNSKLNIYNFIENIYLLLHKIN